MSLFLQRGKLVVVDLSHCWRRLGHMLSVCLDLVWSVSRDWVRGQVLLLFLKKNTSRGRERGKEQGRNVQQRDPGQSHYQPLREPAPPQDSCSGYQPSCELSPTNGRVQGGAGLTDVTYTAAVAAYSCVVLYLWPTGHQYAIGTDDLNSAQMVIRVRKRIDLKRPWQQLFSCSVLLLLCTMRGPTLSVNVL